MLSVHKIMIVNNEHLYGPGKRVLIFLQGCSLHCDGCINKHLWPFEGGTFYSNQELIDLCTKENACGFTIHGGEPLDQHLDLFSFIEDAKKLNLTIVLFTGYLKKELNMVQCKIWNASDIVIAGRFEIAKKNLYLQFRGSTNQRVYFHKGPFHNYKIKDGTTSVIITINNNGSMDINGFLSDDISDITNI